MRPKLTKLSATKISTFEQCPKYYDFQYNARAQRSFTPVEWEVGNIVHQSIAQLFQQVKARHRSVIPRIGNPKWYEPIVSRLEAELRASVNSGSVKIIRPGQSLDQYIGQANAALYAFTAKVLPGLAEQKLLGIEEDLGKYTLAGLEISGRLDLATGLGGNVYVHDWKTGKRRPQDERQARIYYFGCLAKYGRPIVTYRLYHLLEEGEIIETYAFAPEVKLELEREIRALVGQIESLDEFIAKPSILCHWCPFGPQCSEGMAFITEHEVPIHEDLLDLGVF